jgi:hypothetical protein
MSMIASLLAVLVPLSRVLRRAQHLYSIPDDYLTRLDSDFLLRHTGDDARDRLTAYSKGR